MCQEIQAASDLDLSEDEELQQAFDMHSLIVSNVYQEPLFTAEQVIKEIEDMLEVHISQHLFVNLCNCL